MNGYSDKLIAIDDEMVALGRPPPPVVSWLTGGLKGDLNARTAAWRVQIEAWEEQHAPADMADGSRPCLCGNAEPCAIRWLELRQRYIAEEQTEMRLRYSEDAWRYEQLRFNGCPDLVVGAIGGSLRETSALKAAREWMLNFDAWCLVLIGGTGCGKSVAAGWAAHQKLMRNYGVQWVDCAAQAERPMYGTEAELRRFQCRTAPVLVLDDLGTRAQVARREGPWLAWLEDIVGSRANDSKKTIITTNLGTGELRQWLGERLVDRLRTGIIHSSAEKSMRTKPQETKP